MCDRCKESNYETNSKGFVNVLLILLPKELIVIWLIHIACYVVVVFLSQVQCQSLQYCALVSFWIKVWPWTVQTALWMPDTHTHTPIHSFQEIMPSYCFENRLLTAQEHRCALCVRTSVCVRACFHAGSAALAPLCFISIRAQRLGWVAVTRSQREIELNVNEPPWAFRRFGRHTTQTWVTSEIQLSS